MWPVRCRPHSVPIVLLSRELDGPSLACGRAEGTGLSSHTYTQDVAPVPRSHSQARTRKHARTHTSTHTQALTHTCTRPQVHTATARHMHAPSTPPRHPPTHMHACAPPPQVQAPPAGQRGPAHAQTCAGAAGAGQRDRQATPGNKPLCTAGRGALSPLSSTGRGAQQVGALSHP